MTSTAKASAVARLGLAGLGLLAAIVLTLAACGGNDDEGPSESDVATASPTLDPVEDAEYLEALAPALQAVNAQLDSLNELRADAFDGGLNTAAAIAYGEAYETFESERLAAIEALAPGKTLQDHHAAIVFAARDSVALAADLSAAIAESPPANQAQFLDLFGRLDGATITNRFLDACTALQIRATAAGIDVDLQCLQ